MVRRAVAVLGLIGVIAALGARPTSAETIVELPGGGWVQDPRAQASGSEIDLVSGPGQPVEGAGSVRLQSDANRLAMLTNFLLTTAVPPNIDWQPFAGLEGRYSTYAESGGEAPALKFEAYTRPSLISSSFMTVNFEPVRMGTVTPNTWQTWPINGATTVWQSNASLGSCIQSAPCSLTDFNVAFPTANFYDVILGVGTTNGPSVVGYADGVHLTFGAGRSLDTDFEVPTAPVAVDDQYAVPTGDVLSVSAASGVLLNDRSQLGSPMNVALGTAPANGAVQLAADGSFVYTPNAGFSGTDAFTYTAIDESSSLQSTPATVTIVVTTDPPPDPPTPPLPTPPGFNGSRFTPLDPQRIIDTRSGLGATGPLAAGADTTFTATGMGGVPGSGVIGVVLNVTVTEPAAPGFVQVFPAGTGTPGASSNVNVDRAGQTISDLVLTGLDASGRFTVHNQSPTQLVVDVYGYFTPVVTSGEGRLVTVDPIRVLDTRAGLGVATPGPVTPDGSVALTVTSAIPADAAGVVMTLTATDTAAPGFVQVVPTGGTTPLRASSNLNVDRAGETMANLVIVPVGAGGQVTLYSQSGAHLVADVVGYFTGVSAPASSSGLFVPIAPTRLADSRVTDSVLPAGATFDVAIAGRTPLPPVAPSAIAGTVTATETTGSGFVQVFPTGAATPVGGTSSLNINGADRIVAAATILATASGSLTVHTQTATHLVYDATGYFT